MAEITALHIAILAGSVAAGVVIGWLVRGSRCAQEKIAVNEGWQQQLEAQRSEHARLLDQNKGLMEQVNQFQASGKDATNRARELSGALKEAFERRDELQRELKEIRGNLEVAVHQRDRLKSDIRDTTARGETAQSELKRKDDKIFRLSRDLENWQNRLPPLLERYRMRDEEAVRIEEELRAARERIAVLENPFDADETRVEPSSHESLGEELDASNDPVGQTQTGLVEAAPDEPDEESSFSDFVDDFGSEFDDDDRDDITEPEDDDRDDITEPEDDDGDGITEPENDDRDGISEPENDDADDSELQESVGDDDARDETSVAEYIRDESGESESDNIVEEFDDADPATAEVDTIIEDEDESEDAGATADSFDDEPGVDEDDAGDWGSATSAEIARLDDHGPGAGRDDLKLIKGIGPAIENTLNELGIFRFDQIADMSEYDIDRVARRLRGFRSRIYREDWIGQARDLQLQKTAN
jgi:predicted flap endonuclease-1-like 5' DNA nuclease